LLTEEWVMAIQKEHKEFYTVDLDRGGRRRRYPPDRTADPRRLLDEKNRQAVARDTWLQAGVTKPFVHEYWKRSTGVRRSIVGSDASGHGGEKFGPHTYACRPPGTLHGPFRSDTGCLLLELHYYDEQ
jgi:hypothetical protein